MKKGVIVFLILILISLLFNQPIKKGEASSEDKTKLRYYNVVVKGEVKRPDSYNVPAGTELKIVVNLAGGDEFSVYLNEEAIVNKDMVVEVKRLSNNPININRAIRSEIATLPGIGSKTLDKIMDFLKDNSFKSWQEFSEITGIKNAKLLEIKARAVLQ